LKLDAIDAKILTILQRDGNMTNSQLSKEIGLSPAPTLERVKKLENAGYIKSYHAKVDNHKVGLGVCTFVHITLTSHNKKSIDAFVQEINKIDEIIECHHVTGSADFILKVVSKDIASYQKLILNKISEIKEVDGMQSMVVLATFKETEAVPIPKED
jgi:Lrp/AsnC family leucine-responsive transcriptional regulator